MTITLKRKVELKSAVMYLRIQSETRCEEIQKYLESTGFSNPVIERRVRVYLQKLGIYNGGNELTTEGQKTRQTGLVKEQEEGKYQLWYTQNDPLFGNRIFYFRRIKPDTRGNPGLEPIDINFGQETFVSLPIWGNEGKEPVNFSILETSGGYQGEPKGKANIECTWVWNDLQNSSFFFSGKLEWSDYDEKTKTNFNKSDAIDEKKEVGLNIDFKPYINNIIPGWNGQTKRLPLKQEYFNANDIYQYFEYTGVRQREGFESCRYEKLPVEPYNAEEALAWRNRLLKTEIEKQYIHPDDFGSAVLSINQKEGFAGYSGQLNIPDIREYIEKELEHGKKSDRGAAYWHLAAPLDLNVEIPQSLRVDSFSLKAGDSVSFADIAKKMKGDFAAEKVYYYDKYVINYYQQRSVSGMLQCFDVPDRRVITDKNNPDSNDYLAGHEPPINIEDTGNIYQNHRDAPHDRYIILARGGELLVWTSTNSIDYIRFDIGRKDIQPETPGQIRQSVTFTRVGSDVLETRLKNYVLKG
jgi:hypothetical protein